jgi:hypothetical protein
LTCALGKEGLADEHQPTWVVDDHRSPAIVSRPVPGPAVVRNAVNPRGNSGAESAAVRRVRVRSIVELPVVHIPIRSVGRIIGATSVRCGWSSVTCLGVGTAAPRKRRRGGVAGTATAMRQILLTCPSLQWNVSRPVAAYELALFGGFSNRAEAGSVFRRRLPGAKLRSGEGDERSRSARANLRLVIGRVVLCVLNLPYPLVRNSARRSPSVFSPRPCT